MNKRKEIKKEVENEKNSYLENFKRYQDPARYGFQEKVVKMFGTELVDLMKKEGITYDQAYTSLQFAYNLIKYESNFLTLK